LQELFSATFRERGRISVGLIHVYTGEGKGKTSAALGLCLRASGRGGRCLWTSFLKDYQSGEFKLASPPFTLYKGRPLTGFYPSLPAREQAAARAEADNRLAALFALARGEGYTLLVLDEGCTALSLGLLPEESLYSLLDRRPERLEVALTGRDAPDGLLARADYITECRLKRHPYQKGVAARPGVEY